MTTTTAQKIAVMQAFAEGKDIECSGFGGDWSAFSKEIEPNWNWEDCDYRVAETKPSINWDHVSKDYNYLAEDEDGFAFLYKSRPTAGISDWYSEDFYRSDGFASFKPGTCDWKDSLIVRPGYEEGY